MFMLHIWIKGNSSADKENTSAAESKLATMPAPEEGSKTAYLRLLTLVTSAPFDDSLATTLQTSDSNHQLLARFQHVVRKLLRCDIIADDRVTVALPAIDYGQIDILSIRESEPSILATLPGAVTRNVPLDLAGSLRYLAMAVQTPADAAVLPRLAQIETLRLYLRRDPRTLVAATLQHITQLKSLKYLGIRETYNLYDTTSGIPTRSFLHTDDIKGILQSLPGLTELEIPIYPGAAVSYSHARLSL